MRCVVSVCSVCMYFLCVCVWFVCAVCVCLFVCLCVRVWYVCVPLHLQCLGVISVTVTADVLQLLFPLLMRSDGSDRPRATVRSFPLSLSLSLSLPPLCLLSSPLFFPLSLSPCVSPCDCHALVSHLVLKYVSVDPITTVKLKIHV